MNSFTIHRVTHFAFPEVIGGIQVYCHELSELQAKRGYNIELLTCAYGERHRESLTHLNDSKQYRTMRFGTVWTPWDSAGLRNPVSLSLYNYLIGNDLHLVDAHSHLFWPSVLAVQAAKRKNVPSLITVHGLMAYRGLLINALQTSFVRTAGLWALRNASRVICLTQSEAQEVISLGIPREKVRIIPVGVDTKRFRPSPVEEDIVLWYGRFVTEKGIEYLIGAASLIAKDGLPIDFVLVGDGPLRTHMQALAHSTKARIRFVKPLSADLIPRMLERSMIFVLPSVREGAPRSLLEAMASGKAIVAADTPTVREVLKGAGLLVKPRDPVSLAEAIRKLIKDPDLRTLLGNRARAIALAEYDWQRILPLFDQIYDEVHAETRRSKTE